MKKYSLFLLLLLSFNIMADELCEQTTGDQVEQLAADNCAITDAAASCAQSAPDPDGIRKLITNRLDRSFNEQENFRRNWNTYKGTAWNQMFDYNPNVSNDVPQHLLDWFTNNGKAAVTKDEVKNNIIEEFVKFSQKNDCTPIIKHGYVSTKFPSKNFNSDAELKAVINAPGYKEEKDKFFDEYNSRALNRGVYCEKGYTDTRPFKYVAQEYPPCAGSVSGLYKDNAWSASSLNSQLAGEATSELATCIKDAVARGAKIHHISVVSSASALNNTGEAAKKFCKKGFQALSKARAEAARETVLPQLFSNSGLDPATYQSKVILNYDGSNGDGTSGPCPYTIKNGVEVLKDEYKTAEGKKNLDSSKYVNLQVTFEALKTGVKDDKTHYAAGYSCRQIRYECAPIQASSPKQ